MPHVCTYFYITQRDANIPKEHIYETHMMCGHVAHFILKFEHNVFLTKNHGAIMGVPMGVPMCANHACLTMVPIGIIYIL